MRERPGTESDAILGVVPGVVFEPETVDEATSALARCARDRLTVGFVGGGTELGLGCPPSELDVLVRTTGLGRVIEYAPSDQVVVAEAGMPLAALQRVLAPQGQWLALDPPWPDRATLGGIVATNAFGPRRARFGSARDLVLGVSFVRADGTAAKAGGKVVKNVAGFDLPRLMVGALGTLGLLTSVTFRVHPLPEAAATVLFPGADASSATALVAALRAAQLEPTSTAALAVSDRFDLAVRFEGFAAGVAGQVERLVAAAREVGLAGERLADAQAAAFFARHDAVREMGPLRVKVSAPPSRFPEVARSVLPPLLGELSPAGAAFYPSLGLGFVAGRPADARAGAAVLSARTGARAVGGSLVVCEAPQELRPSVDVWGAVPPAFALMQRVKNRLDPDRRLNRGRYLGGL
ncbi:MAG TPA: FAD-binding oxidoreductase [Anaeromyxobacteraceae bacterium]|nr:FAD-binding oxidoreductase [Anaeromyxobacteraceae bacterium]